MYGFRYSLAQIAKAIWDSNYAASRTLTTAALSFTTQHVSASVSFNSSGQGSITITAVASITKSFIVLDFAGSDASNTLRWAFSDSSHISLQGGGSFVSTTVTINATVVELP